MNGPLVRLTRPIVYAFFAGWFGLSVLQQMDRNTVPRKVDPTSMLIPNWRFFGPVPARHDHNVLHRVRFADATTTAWTEESMTTARSWGQVFWHPRRRIEKALFDVSSELFQVSRELKDPRAIQISVSYLSLLNHMTHRVDHPAGAVEVQFLIVRSATHEQELPPELLFLSEWHSLTGGRPDPTPAHARPASVLEPVQ